MCIRDRVSLLITLTYQLDCTAIERTFGLTTYPTLSEVTTRRWNVGYKGYLNAGVYTTCTYLSYDGFEIDYVPDENNLVFMFAYVGDLTDTSRFNNSCTLAPLVNSTVGIDVIESDTNQTNCTGEPVRCIT